MKVIISFAGRFYAFYLVQQLLKRGYLNRFITSYPKSETRKYNIPDDKVDSIIIKEILARGWAKLPKFLRNLYNPQFLISELFDKLASNKMIKSDIFVGLSSCSLRSLRKVKQLGTITIIMRSSSHILYQQEILKQEYKKFGLKPELTHHKIIEKELQEYDEADYIIIPSEFVKRTFLDQGMPETKLICVPFGANLNEFKPIPREGNTFRILHCGAITLRKGVHYLLQAFCSLDLPGAELWLLGTISEEMRPFLKQYNNGKVFLKGTCPFKELYRYYSHGSVFCLASIEEGLAMVIPQAMACGLPVICTTNTGGADLIEDGEEGFIVPIRNVEALKEKILYLYENPEKCAQMAKAALNKVQLEFTWDKYGERTVNAYNKILRRKP